MTESRSIVDDRLSVTSVDGIELHIAGGGPRTIVMVHGWPDTWRLWDAQAAHFAAAAFRCVRFTVPGFDRRLPRRAVSLQDCVRFIGRVVDAVSPDAPVVLMLHDWGCLFGYQYALEQPQRVAAVVGIDVADAHERRFRAGLSLRGALLAAGYQWWLALAWSIGGWPATRRVADGMTRWMARTMGCRSDPGEITAQMNYPYHITWLGSHGGYRGMKPLQPAWPMFYAWGTKKPLMFHSGEWVQQLTRDPRHRAMAFECGHWVMRSRAAEFNAAVAGWLVHTVPDLAADR